MALLQATLKTRLLSIVDSEQPSFVGFPSTKEQVAENWADAYDAYCLSAQDVSTDVVEIVNRAGFKSALIASLPEGAGTAALAAAAFETAFVAYWIGAIFKVGIPPETGIGGNGFFGLEISSVVTAITPNILYDLLLVEFSKKTFETDMDSKADTLATLFHTATTTAVIVTISGTDTTPTPTGPLPIVNISPIN